MSDILSITLKDSSVRIEGLKAAMCRAVVVVYGYLRTLGIPLVITSGNDGTHKAYSPRHPRSLHYEDLAVDFRLPSRFTGKEATDAAVKIGLAGKLGPEYDLVLEVDHFHLEYDPK
jgi:hypothetical protein